jgi:peptidylprolyl isomerase
MAGVKSGDTILVHYKGSLEDGTVFDSSLDFGPVECTIGSGDVIPGFETAVIGMEIGDSKTVRIPSDQAHGPYHQEKVETVARDAIPRHVKPVLGQEYQVSHVKGDCEDFIVRVTGVDAERVVFDANHPLAGKDLVFEIDLVAILGHNQGWTTDLSQWSGYAP